MAREVTEHLFLSPHYFADDYEFVLKPNAHRALSLMDRVLLWFAVPKSLSYCENKPNWTAYPRRLPNTASFSSPEPILLGQPE